MTTIARLVVGGSIKTTTTTTTTTTTIKAYNAQAEISVANVIEQSVIQ